MNEFIYIDIYLTHLKAIFIMSIPVVYDLNFAKCYPSPMRKLIYTKISIISI